MRHTERPITIRLARPEDAHTVRTLSLLDSRPPLTGRALLAEVGGEPWAALGLDDDVAVADPMRPSGPLVDLLRERAGQLEDPATRGIGAARVLDLLRLRLPIGPGRFVRRPVHSTPA